MAIAARYWRLFNATVTSPDSGANFIMGECQWLNGNDTPMPYIIGPYSPAFNTNVFPPENINDGNIDRAFVLAGRGPCFIVFDFGEDVTPKTLQFATGRDDWVAQMPRYYNVAYSSDKENWTPLPDDYTGSATTTGQYSSALIQDAPPFVPVIKSRVSSMATVSITSADPTPKVSAFSTYAIVGETPPKSQGALIYNMATYAIDVEYILPVQYNPISLKPIHAFPLMIGGNW